MRKALLITSVALLLAACASGPSISPEEAALRRSRLAIRKLVSAGRHLEALEAVARERGAGRPESRFKAEVLSAANGAIDAALALHDGGQYASCGLHLSRLIKCYPLSPSIRARVKLPLEEIARLRGDCVQKLIAAGLENYRAGDLQAAVDKWRQVLAFDPANAEARKALDTAVVQMKTFESLDTTTP